MPGLELSLGENYMKRMFVFVSLIMTLSLFVLPGNLSGDVPPGAVPERIVLNVTANPAREMAITWRTGPGVKNSQVEYMIATSMSYWKYKNRKNADPYKDTKFQTAVNETVNLGNGSIVLQHSVVLKNLKPDTLYQYRVGSGETWSEWEHFRTAAAEEKPFKFIFLGDPQNELKSMCSRVFRTAYAAAADAAFVLIGGDLVTKPWQDFAWGELFYAAGWISRRVPFILVAGNHGYYLKNKKGVTKRQHRFWRPHFTQPGNGPNGLEETAFFIDYQGVRLIVLNGNEKLLEQQKWLVGLLADNPNRWTIIAIHHPFYSTGSDRDNPALRVLFQPTIDKYAVDLILQGHDHTYGRTYKLRNGKIVPDSEKGTVYVVSVSGPKFYSINEKHKHLMKKLGTGLQLYQVIWVDGDVLRYESRTVTDELYDSFELRKPAAEPAPDK